MVDCFHSLAHLPRAHSSMLVWFDKTRDDDDDYDDDNDDVDDNGDATGRNRAAAAAATARGEEEPEAAAAGVGDIVQVQQQQQQRGVERILMEIVGAMGLESKQRRSVDPYCAVKVYDRKQRAWKVIHRTDAIRNDGNPIWTAKTKSLCLIDVVVPTEVAATQPRGNTAPQRQVQAGGATIETNATESSSADDDITKSIIIDLCHASTRLGRVCLSHAEVLRHCQNSSNGSISAADRIEFHVQPAPGHAILGTAVLALRFRPATEPDLVFLHMLAQKDTAAVRALTKVPTATEHKEADSTSCVPAVLCAEHGGGDDRKVAADINFQSVKAKALFQCYNKTDVDGNELFRVTPYPDPERPAETEWMNAVDLNRTAHQPSSKWVTAGCGSLGTLYVEVIGCDKLPQMDADLSKTDAFVALAFEDNFLRTDVIWDRFSPRWMPWTTRAFQFAIRHPASLLFLSVLDFDETPVNKHDPIGRVVVRPSGFRPNVTYTLHYALQDDPSEQPSLPSDDPTTNAVVDATALSTKSVVKSAARRGTIILRLRMEWENEGAAMKLYFTPPPRCIINVDNDKSYSVLRYTTSGSGNIDESSLNSVKLLANEIMSYGKSFCFVLDVMMEVLLWRGRWQVTKNRSIWFPIHSMALFVAAAILVERPELITPVVLYAIAWILLSINYHASRHPNPWLRVPSSRETNIMMLLGRLSFFPSLDGGTGPCQITPNQGAAEGSQQEKLDALKAARMSALLQAALAFALRVYRIYSKTGNYAINITTERRNWNLLSSFLNAKLYFIHLLLRYICKYMRLTRYFLSWKSNYTAVFTTNCVMLATAWLIFPVSTIARWLLRILVWTILGPGMKVADIKYFRPWYATKEELLERIQKGTADREPDLPDFDSILESETFRKLVHTGRVKAEELHQLRDMRKLLFGSFSEAIPFTDNSRYPSVPLPRSTAVPCDEWTAPPLDTGRGGYHVPGQLLSGNMIHSRPKPMVLHHYHGGGGHDESNDGPHNEGKKTK